MLQPADFQRTVIIGNGGSGKSWLATQLSRRQSVPAIDLDLIHWEAGGYDAPREKSLAIEQVRRASAGPGWVIEGVYGWLAREALPNATALVWLDIDDGECIANLKERGLRRGGDDASFTALLKWVAEYRIRDNANSFAGHERIFAAFSGAKIVLRSRSDMAELLKEIGAGLKERNGRQRFVPRRPGPHIARLFVDSIALIGYAAAVCTTVSHIPQLMRVWRTRSTEDISLRMFLILAVGLALWTVFGVLKGEMPIILANAVSFAFASTIVAFKLRYG